MIPDFVQQNNRRTQQRQRAGNCQDALQQHPARLPVIIITGYSTETAAIEAVNLGVSGYLTKPFRVPQVLAAAAKAIGEP